MKIWVGVTDKNWYAHLMPLAPSGVLVPAAAMREARARRRTRVTRTRGKPSGRTAQGSPHAGSDCNEER
jgi:hypothetical protein